MCTDNRANVGHKVNVVAELSLDRICEDLNVALAVCVADKEGSALLVIGKLLVLLYDSVDRRSSAAYLLHRYEVTLVIYVKHRLDTDSRADEVGKCADPAAALVLQVRPLRAPDHADRAAAPFAGASFSAHSGSHLADPARHVRRGRHVGLPHLISFRRRLPHGKYDL